jgi:hypothetical protein
MREFRMLRTSEDLCLIEHEEHALARRQLIEEITQERRRDRGRESLPLHLEFTLDDPFQGR